MAVCLIAMTSCMYYVPAKHVVKTMTLCEVCEKAYPLEQGRSSVALVDESQ